MKIIFLDIDGVLNSTRSCLAYNGFPWPGNVDLDDDVDWHKFDDVAINLMRVLVEDSGAKVVLSSTWRHHTNLKQLSNRFGFEIIDKTGSESDNPRGDRIKDWLANHLEVTHYVIIDDDTDMLPSQMEHFVQTMQTRGFGIDELLASFRILDAKCRVDLHLMVDN